jgi:hypothetical protein
MSAKELTDHETPGFEENQNPFVTKFTGREQANLEKLQRIATGIVDDLVNRGTSNTQLKSALIPREEINGFIMNEISKLSDFFLHYFSDTLRELIGAYALEFNYYYRFCVIEKRKNKDMAKRYENFDKNWMNDFIRDFAWYWRVQKEDIPDMAVHFPNINNGQEFLPYLEFDYESLGDLDDYYTEDVIDMIPLPEFPDLIDCLVKMSEHQLLYELYYSKDETLNKFNSEVTGLKSKLNKAQIKALHKKLNNNFLKTHISHFEAFLTNKPLKGVKIVWIDKPPTGNKPNKQTVFALIYLLKENGYLIEMPPTGPGPNNLYRKIEAVFKGPEGFTFKNWSQSNTITVYETSRQKELKKIIQSINLT